VGFGAFLGGGVKRGSTVKEMNRGTKYGQDQKKRKEEKPGEYLEEKEGGGRKKGGVRWGSGWGGGLFRGRGVKKIWCRGGGGASQGAEGEPWLRGLGWAVLYRDGRTLGRQGWRPGRLRGGDRGGGPGEGGEGWRTRRAMERKKRGPSSKVGS